MLIRCGLHGTVFLESERRFIFCCPSIYFELTGHSFGNKVPFWREFTVQLSGFCFHCI